MPLGRLPYRHKITGQGIDGNGVPSLTVQALDADGVVKRTEILYVGQGESVQAAIGSLEYMLRHFTSAKLLRLRLGID